MSLMYELPFGKPVDHVRQRLARRRSRRGGREGRHRGPTRAAQDVCANSSTARRGATRSAPPPSASRMLTWPATTRATLLRFARRDVRRLTVDDALAPGGVARRRRADRDAHGRDLREPRSHAGLAGGGGRDPRGGRPSVANVIIGRMPFALNRVVNLEDFEERIVRDAIREVFAHETVESPDFPTGQEHRKAVGDRHGGPGVARRRGAAARCRSPRHRRRQRGNAVLADEPRPSRVGHRPVRGPWQVDRHRAADDARESR